VEISLEDDVLTIPRGEKKKPIRGGATDNKDRIRTRSKDNGGGENINVTISPN